MKRSYSKPFPSREEQAALFEKARAGDDDAFKALVESHLPLVERIAWKYPDFMPYEDRFQEGVKGLCIAVSKFDPSTGNQLASYAERCIHNEIRDATKKWLGLTELDVQTWNTIREVSDRIWLEEERQPCPEEIGAEANCSAERVKCLARTKNALNLLFDIADPEPPQPEELAAPAEERPDAQADLNDVRAIVNSCLGKLPPCERQAVQLFLGHNCGRRHSLAEIGALLNTTEWKATALKNLGLQRLRRHLTS